MLNAACYAYQMQLSPSLLPPALPCLLARSVGPQGNPRVLAEPVNSSISILTRQHTQFTIVSLQFTII